MTGSKLGFFFGAGASIEFGIPSLKVMTKEFYEHINSKVNDPFQTDLFNKIYHPHLAQDIDHQY